MIFHNIYKRAKYLYIIRNYFKKLNVLEVDTPLAYDHGVTDPFIDLFKLQTRAGKKYLQSSPEYAMKRLLALGIGSIYQICKAFRDESCGQYHNFEFTIIEWYRVGINYFMLMKEMESLFLLFKDDLKFIYLSYYQVFKKYYNFNPHSISLNNLEKIVLNNVGKIEGLNALTISDGLDILFTHKIENKLNKHNTIYFIYDYTTHHSSLARNILNKDNDLVSARFEVFHNGIELANGYYELLNKREQLNRFKRDLIIRKNQGKQTPEFRYRSFKLFRKYT